MTYSELKIAIQRTLADEADIEDQDLDRFIRMFESKVNRNVRVDAMSKKHSINGTGEMEYDLPADEIGLRTVTVDGVDMDYLTPEQMTYFVNQVPRHYTIINGQLVIDGAPGTDAKIEIDYYQRLPALSDTVPSNWLSLDWPDAYLYGSLEHAQLYVYDDNKYLEMVRKANAILEEITQADWTDRWSGGSAVIRAI